MGLPEPPFDPVFRLAPDGRSEAGAEDLQRLADHFRKAQPKMLGYQWSQVIALPPGIADFMSFHLDNIGDPLSPSLTKLNTKFLEREVLKYFIRLWNAPPLAREGEAEEGSDEADGGPGGGEPASWGYVLNMGSTEGTLYALWNARDYLTGTPLHIAEDGGPASAGADADAGTSTGPERRQPVLFVSEEAHYSFAKAAEMVKLDTMSEVGNRDWPGQCPITEDGQWPGAVPCAEGERDGLVDTEALAELVDFFAARNCAPVLVLNVGSTFKGAVDDPAEVWRSLEPVLARHGLHGGEGRRQGYWVHIDGALGAGYLPFLEMTQGPDGQPALPVFDFRLPYVSSMVVSGHKWFGTPYPTGVYLTRNELRVTSPSRPGYVGSPDTTMGGARDGLAGLLMWSALSQRPHDVQRETVVRCLRLARRLHAGVERAGRSLGRDLRAQRAPHSLSVRFSKPAAHVMTEFGLVSQQVPDAEGEEHEEAHLYVMPHVTEETVDLLLTALSAPDAYTD